MQKEDLLRMQEVDVRKVDREKLTDIHDIIIEETDTLEKKRQSFLEQTRNPYVVKAGEYVLKLSFAECEKTLEDRIAEYIQNQAKAHI